MKITLVGMGSGTPGSLTMQGLNALREAELIIGARRLLESLPDGCTGNRAPLYKIEEICALLRTTEAAHVAVAYSGDTGFYSGASALCRALDAAGLPYMVCPGLSSVQLLAAALGRPWQDWKLVSAHGCACTPALVCSADTPTFFLTGGSETPATLCEKLTQSSCGNVQATVGENLGTAAQRLVRGTAQELARQEFAALSVLLVEPCPDLQRRVPGLPDEAFIRGKTPMTKQEVRAAVLAKLAVRPGDILWDVGAGTGSVSIEAALQNPALRVTAIERQADALRLLGDGLLRLLLRADEEDGAAVGDRLLDEVVRLVDEGQRLLEVDDVDAGALGEDEALHLRVPARLRVTEVDAAVEQLADGDDGHGRTPVPARAVAARLVGSLGGRDDR